MAKPMKTKPGLPLGFSAKLYNDLVDLTANQKSRQGGSPQGGGPSSPTTIMVKNGSVGDVSNRFSAMEIDEAIGSDEDHANLKVCNVTVPTSALRPTAIIQGPVKSGDIVEAVIAGTTMIRVNVQATTDTHAEPVVNSTTLRSGTTGRFRFLTPPTTTGVQNILARFESSTPSTGNPRIKNLSGYQVPPWGFLMIDGVETTPTANLALFKSAPVFRGVLPNPLSVFAGKRIVSVPGGALVGETVDCILDGRVPAQIYSDSKNDPLMCHVYGANSINDVTYLRAKWDQTNFGFPILYRESGTGAKWGLIDLMPQNQPAIVVGYWRRGQSGFISIPSQDIPSYFGPYYWQGNPFLVDGTSIFRNGVTKLDVYPTDLRFAGPTTWMGEAKLHFTIQYKNLPTVSGTPFLRYPGIQVKFSVLSQDWTTSVNGFDDAGFFSLPPGIVHSGDVSSMTFQSQPYTITVPFFFTNNSPDVSGLRFQIDANGVANAGAMTFVPQNMTLYMHEVDPLLAQFSSTGTSGPIVAKLSSGSKVDTIAATRIAAKSGYLRMGSGGLRGLPSGSPGSGGGGGPVFE